MLLSSDRDHPAVTARLAAGSSGSPECTGRAAGPWESEQTHESLRRFLLEETYELLDAVAGGNAEALPPATASSNS
ncbi:hypothetical protein MAHJHV60_47060 [Mycobacterium avium subsp. hominissuis]